MFQFNGWIAPLVVVMMYISVSVHLYIQPGGQRIYNRRTYSVKSSAGLICRIIKLSTCMQCGKYQSLRRHSLCMHSNWNTTSIICNCDRIILVDIHNNLIAISCQSLIHRIVHDLIDKMMESSDRGAAYIHSGSFPYGFQAFQYLNLIRSIFSVKFCT